MIVIFYCAAQKDKIQGLLDSQVILKGEEIKTVALPCLAKLEVLHLLKAIEIGAKGVAVWGCADKDCLYPAGSKVGRGRLSYGRRILQEIGIEDFVLQYFGNGLEDAAEGERRFNNWLKEIFSIVQIDISN